MVCLPSNLLCLIITQANSESNLHQLIISINSGGSSTECTVSQRKTLLESMLDIDSMSYALNNIQMRKSMSK